MGELKFKYKVLVLALSLLFILPLPIVGANSESFIPLLKEAFFISSIVESYGIDLNSCLKCQNGGLYLAAVALAYMLIFMLILFVVSFFCIAASMKLVFKWPYKFTISTLLYGKCPDLWKNTNT